MNPAEWKACAIALESYPGDFPARTAEAYRKLLEGLSYDDVMSAIQRHVRSGERWRPSPGEIVALAGRAVTLPPFGVLRQVLTLACRTAPVRLAKDDVTDVLVDQLSDGLAQMFVMAVGGDRIRRVALYTPDDQVERAWESLGRDYAGLSDQLIDQAFLGLGPERPALGP